MKRSITAIAVTLALALLGGCLSSSGNVGNSGSLADAGSDQSSPDCIDIDAATPADASGRRALDESLLGASCEETRTCAVGSCYSFAGAGLRCAIGVAEQDPCKAVTCPCGWRCWELESYPQQIACQF